MVHIKITTVIEGLWRDRDEEQNSAGGVDSDGFSQGRQKRKKIKEGKLSFIITKDVNYSMTGDKKDP